MTPFRKLKLDAKREMPFVFEEIVNSMYAADMQSALNFGFHVKDNKLTYNTDRKKENTTRNRKRETEGEFLYT